MKKRAKSQYCTNCGRDLFGEYNFCPECGQENDNKRQSFGKVMADLIQGFLSIDSRLAHSLPALFFKPGFLTKEYLSGRRQHYLDPVRMFITIVVIYFILASFGETGNISGQETSIADAIEHAENRQGDTVFFNEGQLKNTMRGEAFLDSVQNTIADTTDELELDEPNYKQIKAMVKRGKKDTREILDSLNIENTAWNRFYYGEIIKFAGADFEQFKQFLYSKLPWIIFFLMPVFALLLQLIYFRRDFLYIDHLIFAFHLHSFMFMAGICYLLLFNLTGIDLTAWILLAILIYTLFAFRNFYMQSWRKTIFKIFILWFLYAISTAIAFVLSMIVIFLIY